MKARDVDNAIKCMEEVMKLGYQGEQDLFIARLQLDLIARYEGGLEASKRVAKHFIKSED